MSRLSYAEARRALASAQKAGAGVPAYLRWVNRPLGGRTAVIAATWGASPNGVTAVSALVGAVGIGVLAGFPEWWAGPVGAALLLIGYLLDSADGQLARIQGRGGPAGEWLDHVVDGVRAPLVHVAVAVHLLRTDAALWLVLIAGLFSVLVSGWFLSQLLAEKLLPKPNRPARDSGRGILESFVKQPQDPSTTYVVVAFIGLPVVFAVLYAGLFAWHTAIFAVSLRRKHAQLVSL
ncbi:MULTISPECIES: CDP-alcohol phosphatidyltransferase family protein [unclassified Microbacterium]|uniref:CDP-alcohol phosphatidyltransferase family protein n=1 Tax=unclassified Microbacterium TaxID=2609290 RepID=UPI000EA9CBE7|nr:MULTISPECIES: CDP-alcohol phosphatidyltransferase family protein [unclassified Microbacterium]MBT2484567.1 CDP-alcohol phosphatidyltransferase family protein [Microbacterium sp. ISL-108]RKN67464.1 CDP-alcohol phosphatidyltransferase family protein [Microbacterium sp. CGR2]